jgi:hypothetical protein
MFPGDRLDFQKKTASHEVSGGATLLLKTDVGGRAFRSLLMKKEAQ